MCLYFDCKLLGKELPDPYLSTPTGHQIHACTCEPHMQVRARTHATLPLPFMSNETQSKSKQTFVSIDIFAPAEVHTILSPWETGVLWRAQPMMAVCIASCTRPIGPLVRGLFAGIATTGSSRSWRNTSCGFGNVRSKGPKPPQCLPGLGPPPH